MVETTSTVQQSICLFGENIDCSMVEIHRNESQQASSLSLRKRLLDMESCIEYESVHPFYD